MFKDRSDAGKQLAQALNKCRGKDLVVYALPRGGVVVAAEVAKVLKAPLDLIIVRKIGHPYNPEYAICAVAEDGHMICNEQERANVDEAWFDKKKDAEQQEAQRRRQAYLGDRPPIDANGKIAILVDDGVATGLTFLTAIQELRHENPNQIVAALPVAPQDTAEKIKDLVDQLVCLQVPSFFMGAVGAYYQNFDQVEDQEVISILRSSQY
jgi:predicted phosphoribosyltransferase